MRTKVFVLSASVLAAATAGCSTGNTEAPGGAVNPTTMMPGDGMQPSTVTAGSGAQPMAAPPTAGTGTGAAGAAAPMMPDGMGQAGTGGMQMPTTPEPGDPVDNEFPDPRGCPGLDSGFPGDETCMLPPDPSEGFQIHIGPTDYTDQAQIEAFSFPAGAENSMCWSFHTPNTEDKYYQTYVLSGRPGTHHIINTMYATDFEDGTRFTACMDGGTGTNTDIIANLPGASKAYMPRKRIAPENAHLGKMIPANTASQADMHYFNFTDETILREFWMNIYTVPADQVQEESSQIRGMGGISWTFAPIAPGTDMVYQYSCPIESDGRIIGLLGHYHAHGKRFSAYLRRQGGAREKVFEMYDYNDPQIFSYDSITTNPAFADGLAGATSGILEVQAGDVIDWECHIVNVEPDGTFGPPLRYVNEVRTGEMCNLWGESVGPRINCVVP